jgi:hypothetical protein
MLGTQISVGLFQMSVELFKGYCHIDSYHQECFLWGWVLNGGTILARIHLWLATLAIG